MDQRLVVKSFRARRKKQFNFLLDFPHRQVVFTIPRMLRLFFKYNRSLLSELCLCGKEALVKYFKATTGKDIAPGIIAVIQSFGNKLNFHPHLHFLVTEIGADKEGWFHKVTSFNDSLLCRFFAREVLSLLLGKQLINPELVKKILSWRHSGFNVHSKVKTESKKETAQVGKYMIHGPKMDQKWGRTKTSP